MAFSFETNDGKYVSCGGRDFTDGTGFTSALITKIDHFGELLDEMEILKTDTNVYLYHGFQKQNNHYYFIGTATNDTIWSMNNNMMYVCETDTSLNLLWDKIYPLPYPYKDHLPINFLVMPDDNILVQGRADTATYDWDDFLYTCLFSQQGDLLDLNFYGTWKDAGIYSAMEFNPDTSKIIFIGMYGHGPSGGDLVSRIEMNLSLEITSWSVFLEGDYNPFTPTSFTFLPDGNIVMTDRHHELPNIIEGLYLRLMTPEYEMIRDTFITYGSYINTPVFSGLGYSEEGNIWVTTFQGVPTSWPGTSVFNIHIFDSDLNLRGIREYGGDTRYWFFHQLMTSDGGCLLTGMIPDYEGTYNNGCYLFKVMPQDIITGDKEYDPEPQTDELFPNPFTKELNIRSKPGDLTLNIYNLSGEKIAGLTDLKGDNTSLSTQNWASGMYFYQIFNKTGQLRRNGKLIKQ